MNGGCKTDSETALHIRRNFGRILPGLFVDACPTFRRDQHRNRTRLEPPVQLPSLGLAPQQQHLDNKAALASIPSGVHSCNCVARNGLLS
jgi:hypothetical protein